MGDALLSRLFLAAGGNEPSALQSFVTIAFAELLRDCPGLAGHLFGDLGPIDGDTPAIRVGVPVTTGTSLDLVIEGRNGFHLLIENRLVQEVGWFEERSAPRLPSHVDGYISAARHHYGGRSRVVSLARSQGDGPRRRYPDELYAGVRLWSAIYQQIESALDEAAPEAALLLRQFLHLLKEHDMNPSDPIMPDNADTILAFDHLARNYLRILEDAVGRIRQEFDLKVTPNNRRLTGWYACSDRFQADQIHLFFYLMFPPVPDLVVRPAVQVTKESSAKGMAAAAEHGFRRGRWGSLWIERDFRKQHPFLALPAPRQVEELVRFFQTPLTRLSKAGIVKVAPARHQALAAPAAAPSQPSAPESEAKPSSAAEPPAEKTRDAPSAAEPLAEKTRDAPSAAEPLAEKTRDAPSAAEPLAEQARDAPSAAEPLAEKTRDAPSAAQPDEAGQKESGGVEPAATEGVEAKADRAKPGETLADAETRRADTGGAKPSDTPRGDAGARRPERSGEADPASPDEGDSVH